MSPIPPHDLQRGTDSGRSFLPVYYHAIFFVAAALLVMHALTGFLKVSVRGIDPLLLGIEASLALIAVIGAEMERHRHCEPKPTSGAFLAVLGVVQTALCMRTGGLASPYYVFVASTAVFAGIALRGVQTAYVAAVLSVAYILGVRFAADVPSGMNEAEVATALAVHVAFLALSAALAGYVARRQRATVQTLAEESMHDPLTSLDNRRCFMKKMSGELERAQRFAWPITMLVIDLDHFKKMNDVHGHAAGDDILVEVAQLLRDTVPSLDHMARVGGEEFAVAAVAADPQHGRELAERLVRAFRGHDWTKIRPALRVTASVGIAVLPPGDRAYDPETAIHDLMERADKALYFVKQNGRDGYHVADEESAADATLLGM